MFEWAMVWAFLQVVMIDLVLAGDNAVVVGMAAAGLPQDQRLNAILVGIAAATLLLASCGGRYDPAHDAVDQKYGTGQQTSAASDTPMPAAVTAWR